MAPHPEDNYNSKKGNVDEAAIPPQPIANDDDGNNNNEEKEEETPQEPPRRRRVRRKQLSTDRLNWDIPHNDEATRHVREETQQRQQHESSSSSSWRYDLIKTLHGRRVQMTLAFLLLLDVLILFAELALLTLYPSCSLVERDAISCCAVPTTDADNNSTERRLAGGDDDGDAHYSCAAGLTPVEDNEATCDSHKYHTVHSVEVVLISVTISILVVFFVELNLSMLALRPAIFFRQVFYAVDYFIVTVSLVLEVLFVSLGDEMLASLVGLVILGRLWRFVRIGHGIVELADGLAADKHLEETVYTRQLESLLLQHGIPLPEDLPAAGHHHHSHAEGGDGDDDDDDHRDNLLERVHDKHINKRLHEYQRRSKHGSTNSQS